jgi:PIN domain nuclease of toxin-antitoxin system
MPLLLDTCAAIWIVANAPISAEAEDALDQASDRGEEVYVSPITAWEIGLLWSRGRFASAIPPKTWFSRLVAIEGFRLAELSPDVFIDSCALPGDVLRDPSDRIIVATARAQDFTILTRDRPILSYAAQGNVRALAC